MAADDFLRNALIAINADALAAEFLADASAVSAVSGACERLALWGNSLRMAEPENVASPFLFEMQRASHDVAALLAFAQYIPAAAAMRAGYETAMYYTYFREHPTELATLATSPDYYISKKEILEFHKIHSPHYRRVSREFGFPSTLNRWYSRVSAIIHGQLPGTWGQRLALSETKHTPAVLKLAVEMFTEGVEVIHDFLLLTVGAELWSRFHHAAKKQLLKGMPADRRILLSLDGK